MRTVKIIAGLACFAAALFPGLLVLGELNFFFVNLPFLICALWFVGTGCFLIAQRNSPMSKKAKVLIALAIFPFAMYIIAVVVPGFVAASLSRSSNACVNNLRQIDGAKQEWALENNKHSNDIPTSAEISLYLLNNKIPVCPKGGTYTIGRMDENPTCSVGTADWPNTHALNPTNNWWTNFKAAYSKLFGFKPQRGDRQ